VPLFSISQLEIPLPGASQIIIGLKFDPRRYTLDLSTTIAVGYAAPEYELPESSECAWLAQKLQRLLAPDTGKKEYFETR
jgi:hypothetical protein